MDPHFFPTIINPIRIFALFMIVKFQKCDLGIFSKKIQLMRKETNHEIRIEYIWVNSFFFFFFSFSSFFPFLKSFVLLWNEFPLDLRVPNFFLILRMKFGKHYVLMLPPEYCQKVPFWWLILQRWEVLTWAGGRYSVRGTGNQDYSRGKKDNPGPGPVLWAHCADKTRKMKNREKNSVPKTRDRRSQGHGGVQWSGRPPCNA